MECKIRKWKIEDKTDLARNLNNRNILDMKMYALLKECKLLKNQ